jgi:hypothetical protein
VPGSVLGSHITYRTLIIAGTGRNGTVDEKNEDHILVTFLIPFSFRLYYKTFLWIFVFYLIRGYNLFDVVFYFFCG